MENLYFIAILPSGDLSRQIDEIRRECAEQFKVKAALKPPVHITLHPPFKLDSNRENQLLRLMAPAAAQDPFTIRLENFNAFNIHTLFIQALKNPQLTALYKTVGRMLSRHKFDPKQIKGGSTGFSPHITVAYRDIPAETFPLIWEAYKDRKFKREFTCDSFALLRHNGREWKVLKKFLLKGEPAVLTLF